MSGVDADGRNGFFSRFVTHAVTHCGQWRGGMGDVSLF